MRPVDPIPTEIEGRGWVFRWERRRLPEEKPVRAPDYRLRLTVSMTAANVWVLDEIAA